jgi:hypothetical protein
MLMTIFGAGASYDSVDLTVTPGLEKDLAIGAAYRPPLASELFDERPAFIAAMNNWPQIAPLIPRLRRASTAESGQTVEEALREIQEEAADYPQRISHLIALENYLAAITDTPIWEWIHSAGSSTNYAELLDQIEQFYGGKSPALFVTFNYDAMLELAFNSVLMRNLRALDDYIPDRPESALIKPHGSVNWIQGLPPDRVPTLPGNPGNNPAIQYAPILDFTGGQITTRSEGSATIWHPAIAIPLDRGKTFVCPPQHLNRMKADIQEVTHILIVGWRATEDHFLKVLSEHLRKDRPLSLCIVDVTTGAETVYANLQKSLEFISFGPVKLHGEGFSAFVRQRRVREWLSGLA